MNEISVCLGWFAAVMFVIPFMIYALSPTNNDLVATADDRDRLEV